jgi:putative addiction module killer protein/probable addiction module antidote protein
MVSRNSFVTAGETEARPWLEGSRAPVKPRCRAEDLARVGLTNVATDAYKLQVSCEIQRTGLFDVWLDGLTDKIAKKAIHDRIIRVESGLLGDRRSVGNRVGEFKVDVGQGYRLYYTMRGRTIVLLLCGGSKKGQRSDIKKAEAMAKAMNKGKETHPAGRVRERQAAYVPKGDESDEYSFTEADLEIAPFDAADYIKGDDETQIYLLRQALASGHPAYIANAVGAVARARGLSSLERETGIKRQTLNKSLSLKGNPTLETLLTVLKALGLRLEVVEDRLGHPPTP